MTYKPIYVLVLVALVLTYSSLALARWVEDPNLPEDCQTYPDAPECQGYRYWVPDQVTQPPLQLNNAVFAQPQKISAAHGRISNQLSMHYLSWNDQTDGWGIGDAFLFDVGLTDEWVISPGLHFNYETSTSTIPNSDDEISYLSWLAGPDAVLTWITKNDEEFTLILTGAFTFTYTYASVSFPESFNTSDTTSHDYGFGITPGANFVWRISALHLFGSGSLGFSYITLNDRDDSVYNLSLNGQLGVAYIVAGLVAPFFKFSSADLLRYTNEDFIYDEQFLTADAGAAVLLGEDLSIDAGVRANFGPGSTTDLDIGGFVTVGAGY